jgi:hypothetical protein
MRSRTLRATEAIECDPSVFAPVPRVTLGQVVGDWGRNVTDGATVIDEQLTLVSGARGGAFALLESAQPECEGGAPCPGGAVTRRSEGTFSLDATGRVVLAPSASSSTRLVTRLTLERTCLGRVRLSGDEAGARVYLAGGIAHCLADDDCAAVDVGPNPFMCKQGFVDAVVCSPSKDACMAACRCPAGQRMCPLCGAPPPDGHPCPNVVCLDDATPCPPVP